MSKGTIIYLGGFELPDKNAAAHRVLNNGKIMRQLGYNVVFIGVDKGLKYGTSILTTKKLIQGFESWSVPYPQSKKEWCGYLSKINSLKEVISEYPDVKCVIVYNYQAVALMRLKIFCKKRNIKVAADCTEWYSTKGTNLVFKILKGFDSFLRMRIIQKRLDGLIVISKFLESYYKRCANVTRIPPLVDLAEEKWNMPASEENKIRFVYAGSPGKNKDKVNYLIHSLHELRSFSNYVFHVVGITNEQYVNDFPEHKDLLEQLGDRVRFHGRLSHCDSIRILRNSDFSVFVRENTRVNNAGFPTKFVESVSCETPVVTTRTSDLQDYITVGQNGFFLDLYEVNSATSTIERILQMNLEDIKQLKTNCPRTTFHYENYIEQMKRFVDKMID